MYKLYKNRRKYKFKESFEFLSFKVKINKIEISIVNDDIIKVFIKDNINNSYNQIIQNTLNFLEDDDDSNSELVLSELSNLHNLIFNIYKDYFTKAEINKYGRNIRLLVSELKKKIKNKEYEEIKTTRRR